jgi:hypothetical protein
MNTENFRVVGKQKAHMNGRRTTFTLYRKRTHEGGFVFEGVYTAPGWAASDEQCIRCALEAQDLDRDS